MLEASCDDGATGRFLCQVTFLSNDDPSQRLYFDIVAVERTDKGWELPNGPIGSHCHSRYGWASIERQAGGRSAAASGFSGPGLG